MHHEPSGSCLPLQPTADQRCRFRRAAQPLDDLHAQVGTPAGCAPCRNRSAAIARRRQQRTLHQITRRAEAGYRALLAQHPRQEGGDDAP
jgi:hypothetical protein